ncbi:MAG: DUF4157 domain-containing protein [Myxococcales bacterium]|nr:DUF4157 domain-containing protein [Myxococcales bacterium]
MPMDTETQTSGPGAGAPPSTLAPRDAQTAKPAAPPPVHEQAPAAPEAGGEGEKRKGADLQTQEAMNGQAKGDRYAGARERQSPAATGGNYGKTKQATQPPKPRSEPVPKKFERVFGYDFSQVSIHFGTGLPEKQGADAFTQGTNIYFSDAAPKPDTAKGGELLGHELTHVVQQNADLPPAPGAAAAEKGADGKPKSAEDADKTAPDNQGASDAKHGTAAPSAGGEAGGAEAGGAEAGGAEASTGGASKDGAAGEQQADAAGAGAAKGEAQSVSAGTATAGAVQKKAGDATAGTQESAAQTQAQMDATVDDRVAALKQIIAAKDWDGTTRQLAGGGADLDAKYLAAHGVGLREALAKAFPTVWQQEYLSDLIRTGKPSRTCKIALSLGLVSTPAADENEVVRLCEEAEVGEWFLLWRKLSGWCQAKLSKAAYDRLKTWDSLMTALRAKPTGNDVKAVQDAQLKWQVGHLASIIKHRCGYGVDRENLLADVTAWVGKASIEERTAAFADGSALRQALDSSTGYLWGIGRQDKQQVLDLVKPPEKLPAATQPATPAAPDAAQDPEVVKKAEADRKQQVADADAMSGLDRAIAREKGKWFGKDAEALKTTITAMTNAQREMYLLKHLSWGDGKEYQHAATNRARKQALFDQAMAAIAKELRAAGLGDKDVASVTGQFLFGADAGGAYLQLKGLLGEDATPKASAVVELVSQLKGAEFAQVRQDKTLLDAIKSAVPSGSPQWEQVAALLGVTDVVSDKTTMSEDIARQGEDDAMLNPDRFATLIDLEIKKVWLFPDKDKILGQMHATQHAAMQSEGKLKAQQQAVTAAQTAPKPPQGPQPMTASDFLFKVYMKLPVDSIVWLDGNLPPVHDAITEGWQDPSTWITVEDRLQQAKGTVAGLGSADSAIVASFEEVDGVELLEEWSNIEEFRNLGTQLGRLERTYQAVAGAGPEHAGRLKEWEAKIAGVRDQQGKFILNIREDRRQYLQSQMSTGEVVETLKKLTTKLTTAADRDPEFQQALVAAKMPNDAYMRERMQSLAGLEQQKLKDTGLQFNGPSAKSQERKESSNELLADNRQTGAAIATAGGDKDKVQEARDQGAEKMAKSREELDRRTAAFDDMRSKAKEIAGTLIAVLAGVIVTAATGGAGAAGLPILYQLLIAGGTAVVKEAANWAIEGAAYKKSDLAKEVILACLQVGIDKLGEAVEGALGASKYGPNALKEALGDHPYLGEALANQYNSQVMGVVTGVPGDLARSFLTDEKPFANMGATLKASLKSKLAEAPQAILLGGLKDMAKKGMFEGLDKGLGTDLSAATQTTVAGAVSKEVLGQEAGKVLDLGGQTAKDMFQGKSTEKVDTTSVALSQLRVAQAGLEQGMDVKHKEDVLKSGDAAAIADEMKIASDDPAAVADRLKGLSLADATKKLESHYLATLCGAYGYDKVALEQFGIEDKATFSAFVTEAPKGWANVGDAKKAVKGWLEAKKAEPPAPRPVLEPPKPTNSTAPDANAPGTASGAIAP